MLPGFILIPAGMGLAVPAMTTAILSSVDRARSGTASAVLNAARQVGGAIGVATFGALVSGVTAERIISGLNIAALTSAALLIIATVIALFVRPKDKDRNVVLRARFLRRQQTAARFRRKSRPFLIVSSFVLAGRHRLPASRTRTTTSTSTIRKFPDKLST